MAMPWQNLLGFEFPAVAALKVAFDSEIWAKVVLVSGLIGLLATWNSFFIAASRTIFALGRARIIHAGFAKIHPAFGSPSSAILFVGVTSSAGVILGRGAIMPIVNTASGCWVLLYFLVSFGIIWMRRTQPGRVRPYRIPGGLTIPVLAALASLLMLFESFYLPYINNKGRIPVEWILFFGWGLLGVLFWKFGNRLRAEVSERKRRELILGKPAQKAL